MQNVIPRKCDLCEERSTSLERNDQGDVRLCDRHYFEKHGNNGFDWDLHRRRQELKNRIAKIIDEGCDEMCIEADVYSKTSPEMIAEKILQELKL